jgi:hypothetical protein
VVVVATVRLFLTVGSWTPKGPLTRPAPGGEGAGSGPPSPRGRGLLFLMIAALSWGETSVG